MFRKYFQQRENYQNSSSDSKIQQETQDVLPLFSGPDDCKFEAEKWCHWIQDKEDTAALDWYRHTGPTTSSGTGPPGDHTSGSGL